MLIGIHHTAISTPDLDRSVAFYRDLFGFEVAFDFRWDASNDDFKRTHAEPETAGRVVMLERGRSQGASPESSRLEIFEYATPVPQARSAAPHNVDHGLCHFSFEVRDIETEFARLREAGMVFLSEPVPQSTVKCCYGRDPDGNLIELIEYFDHVVDGSDA